MSAEIQILRNQVAIMSAIAAVIASNENQFSQDAINRMNTCLDDTKALFESYFKERITDELKNGDNNKA